MPKRLLLRSVLPGVLFATLLSGMAGMTPAAQAVGSPPGITLSGRTFLINGHYFIPYGFTSIALLNSPWCSNPATAAAASNLSATELATARSAWNANTLRFQVSQPVLAGPNGAAYAQQIQAGVSMARSAGYAVIVSMQDESSGCGPAEPLPSQETEDAWAALIGNTTLSSDPYVMFELFNEPQNVPTTAPAANQYQTTWLDWLNGGRVVQPRASDTWQAYTPVGHQALVDYLRGTLNVTNVLIADGALYAERLEGVPILSDPQSTYQVAYAVHPFYYTSGEASWRYRWGYLRRTHAVIATAWNYGASGCGQAQQAMAPQFLSYMRYTAHIGVLGYALDNFVQPDLMADTALDPTQCGTASPGGGYDFLNDYLKTFPPA